jgi:hypothetical protein
LFYAFPVKPRFKSTEGVLIEITTVDYDGSATVGGVPEHTKVHEVD